MKTSLPLLLSFGLAFAAGWWGGLGGKSLSGRRPAVSRARTRPREGLDRLHAHRALDLIESDHFLAAATQTMERWQAGQSK